MVVDIASIVIVTSIVEFDFACFVYLLGRVIVTSHPGVSITVSRSSNKLMHRLEFLFLA